MKKWVWIGATGLLVVLAMVWIGQPSEVVTLDGVQLKPRRVEQTVSCSGVVEASGGTTVSMPLPCVISSVEVKVGQRVEQGDSLMTIDKEASRALLQTEADLVALAAMEDRLTAPVSGVITAVNGETGTIADATQPCVVIVEEEDLRIRISIQEKDLPKVKSGMPVRVSGDGFAHSPYAGILQEVSFAANMDTGGGAVIQGVVCLDDKDASLRLGLSARAAVITSVMESGIVIPYEAVVSDEQGSFVYVVEKGRVCRYPVTAEAYVTDGVMVTGADWEDRVVVCQPEQVSEEGMAVEVTLS